MLLFATWMALGALAGLAVGFYRCSDPTSKLVAADHNLHIGFCTGVGALGGFALFAVLTVFYYTENLST